jgi:sulfotransferase family protein
MDMPSSEPGTCAGDARPGPKGPVEVPQPPAQRREPHTVDHSGQSSARPVFVVGCPRSGTTLLYDLIQSSGDFARAPFESDTFRILGPRFPNLALERNRKKLLEFWLKSENGVQSRLERADIEARVMGACQDIGDFLRIVMEAMCRKQGVRRWAEKTPDHALNIPLIKRFFPDSLIVHIIRDGRDAALSLANFRWIAPYFWQRGSKRLSFGVYWKWIVRKARASGRALGRNYYELHYEDLVEKPQETLTPLGEFIGHNLDYVRIKQNGVGSVEKPYSSFQKQAPAEGFNPVARWKKQYSPEELARFEALVGDCLEETGYQLATDAGRRRRTFSVRSVSSFYVAQLELKHQIKFHTPLGRFAGWRPCA